MTRRLLLFMALTVLVSTSACLPGRGDSDESPAASPATGTMSRAQAEQLLAEVSDLTDRAFSAAAEQVGASVSTGGGVGVVSCSEQGAGAAEVQTRDSLLYAPSREAGASEAVSGAWRDLGLEVTQDQEGSVVGVTTIQDVEVQLSLSESVRMQDGSGQQLRYLGVITPRCFDVGADLAGELRR